jgi:tol-pal system protein YbgF
VRARLHTALGAAACALLFLGPAACVTTASEGEQMRKDIAQLRSELEAQQKSAQAEREQLRAEQAKAVKELNAAMDTLNRGARKTGADLAVDLEKAQQDLATLKGQLEVVNHKLEATDKAQADRDKKLDEVYTWATTRKRQMEAAEHPTDKAAIYQLALKKLDAGDTARARELLSEFLQKFKNDAFAPNAQYWLGESYYAERRFNDAIVEFQKVLKDWKSSEKTPDALLKIGMSFQAQGDCQNAVLFFDEVVGSHKGSGAAKTAKDKLGECKKKRATR